jgi:7-carboxy-7-deazaguanine synthase
MRPLHLSEIYTTILGESRETGACCVIVRLTGCHRRCTYCDSAHAFEGGEARSVDEVVAAVRETRIGTVLVTGGEPLLQPACPDLLAALLADGRKVVLETSGTRGAAGLDTVPDGVIRVVDVKTPGSGIPAAELDREGWRHLDVRDELKFVCCDRADYEWSRELVRSGVLPAAPRISFSAAEGRLAPADLAAWILEDALDVHLQVQLHKLLWPGRDRGV